MVDALKICILVQHVDISSSHYRECATLEFEEMCSDLEKMHGSIAVKMIGPHMFRKTKRYRHTDSLRRIHKPVQRSKHNSIAYLADTIQLHRGI